MGAEREDTGPTVASDEVGSAGADSEIDLLSPAFEPHELLRPVFPGAPDPVADRVSKGRPPNRWLLIPWGRPRLVGICPGLETTNGATLMPRKPEPIVA